MREKTETIGRVNLDYTWYPGEDLYSDGEIEEKLLSIAREHTEQELNEVIAREQDWAVLYHMSHVRENIVRALPIKKGDRVLEIGSGCGAITGALSDMAGEVTCIDLSSRRSQVNAWRHRDQDNINILVGNFQDIEPNLDQDYDWITLIGVFEYASAYIGTDAPYHAFLEQVGRHLKKGGRLIIAIENRLGLKYWAGCREDHTGNLFDGLEDYPNPTMAHTFSKPQLETILKQAGFTEQTFYYPYPDYKLPQLIFSDDYLPKKGQLSTNHWNFDREKLDLFNETAVFDSLIEDGLFPQFSNSFLCIVSREEVRENSQLLHARFSNERSREFGVVTRILQEQDSRVVVKTAAFPEGQDHIRRMPGYQEALTREFGAEGFAVNTCREREDGSLAFDWAQGETLEEKALTLWQKDQRFEAVMCLQTLTTRIRSAATEPFAVTPAFTAMFGLDSYPFEDRSLPVTNLDMVAENVLCGPEGETLIDYEWTCDFPVPVSFVLYRIWHYFETRAEGPEAGDELCRQDGITPEQILLFRQMEKSWQEHIQDGMVPLRELYAPIGPGVRDVKTEMLLDDNVGRRCLQLQIFSGADGDFDLIRPVTRELTVEADGAFRFVLDPADFPRAKSLRIDLPTRRFIRVRFERITARSLVQLRPLNAFTREGMEGWDEFPSWDPAYALEADLTGTGEIVLEGHLQMVPSLDSIQYYAQSVAEKNAYRAEMEALRQRLAQMQSTKGWKAIEKVRQLRNYIMARVHGLKIVGDKKAILAKYQEWFREHQADESRLAAQRRCELPQGPKISILVPLYNTPENYLREMISSVQAQTYGNWELCLADGSPKLEQPGGSAPGQLSAGTQTGGQSASMAGQAFRTALTAIVQEYAAADPRIRYAVLDKNLGISENTNAAAELATGSYIALLDHDDLIPANALYEMAQAAVTTGADFLYSDEDKVDMEGRNHFDPNLKPDFSPDLLRSHNYITHLALIRRELFEAVGLFRSAFDGAQDYDLFLRVSEQANRVVHVPKILYFWRCHPNSTAENPQSKMYAYEAGRRALEEHLVRIGHPGQVKIVEDMWGTYQVTFDTPGDPLVSVIIPNKDHTADLDRCLKSLAQVNTYSNLEVVVVENNSTDPKTFAYYEQMSQTYPFARMVRWEKPFNYSAINNFGVAHAKGDLLLFLNNDTQLISPEGIREMAGHCLRPETGCVGAKLLYADDTVQHAGVVLGFGGYAGHVFHRYKKDVPGFMMRGRLTGNWSAVTAACLMVRREVFDQVGGFPEQLPVACNDVYFCLSVREAGYLNVMTPFSLWHHYESISRGYEDTPEKKARFDREVEEFRKRWGETVDAGDPYYNPNLSVQRAPFTLW
ncbi:MAG: glycosyltransferase [Lachnospiraceae bacterium]|nr:glycosyltransferase [Lachnospiraceae bacterium]